MAIQWPTTRDDYQRLAETVVELVCGRGDVAARYFDFEAEGGRRIKGWGPWKGRRVAKDYKALPGQLIQAYKDHKEGGIEYRILNPLTAQNVIEHLRGKERLGVYVLDAEARCKFLAADFDDHQGMLAPEAVLAEVLRFVGTCETHGWRVHIERSKSGRGYHVWLFFDAPVDAAKARAIGRWLFEESQLLREGEDFETFDRFFPAQSVLPPAGKGYGNLIGLPLCGPSEYAAGKTAWVDKEGQLITDAVGHTLEILQSGRNPAGRVDVFMTEWKLSIEQAEVYAGGARDPNVKLGAAEEFDAMRSRCAFLRWAADPLNQPKVKEPLWYALISNMARFDVDDAIHQASSAHPGYSAIEADLKIQHARGSSGPHKCQTIQGAGFTGCPKGGCKLPNGEATKAPAGLAVWGAPREPKRGDRTVRIDNLPAPAPVIDIATGKPVSEDAPPRPWASDIPTYPDTKLPWPTIYGGFNVSTEGVKDHNNQFICLKPVWVDAITQNNLGQMGVLVKFFDLFWRLRTHAFPRERFGEQGGALARELMPWGLSILPGKEKWVSRYLVIQENYVKRTIRAANRLGWFDARESPAVFVLPDQVIGKTPHEIVYQPEVPMNAAETLHGQGTLKEWQTQVARACGGNPMLMFAVMLGLAGPLLKLCQEQSGGFHLYGVTTAGKTTAAQVAASVWGCAADPQEGPEVTSLRKWYVTGNALESLAEVHNDTLLVLDEISEVDPHELGRIIYQLAGGLSKGRANAGGGLRMMRAWRLLFLSTGEKSVRQRLSEVGQAQKGGQRVRMPDIPADDDREGQRAIVQDPHGKKPEEFIQDLKAACARHYGLAGPVFVTYLIAQAEMLGVSVLSGQLREELRSIEAVLCNGVESVLPPEGRRVIRRFALVALAGARAQLAGILSWDLGVIMDVVKQVRDRWLSDQGQEHSELERALAHLRNQLIRHGDRFRWIDGGGAGKPQARDLLGFRVKEFFLFTDEGLRELCGEHDMRTILRALKAQNYLWHDKDRFTRKSPKIEEFGDTRPNLYWLSVKFLGPQDDMITEEDKKVAVSQETRRPRRYGDQDDIPF